MGIARRKPELDPVRGFAQFGGLKRFTFSMPRMHEASGFRLVSYLVVAAAAIVPALVWNSLTIPGDSGREPGMPVYGPFVLIGGILVLEAALILWIKMLQFGNERVRRRRERRAVSRAPGAEDVPGEPRHHHYAEVEAVEPKASARPRVLVVDDDPINRMILRKQLIRLNVEPVSAADGMEALETVREGHWDLVLMDGQMPRLDGPETAHEIRLRELLPPEIPIVGISTNDTPEFRERCLKSGMQACYHKPVRRFVLEKVVDMYIRHNRAETPDHIVDRALASESAST